MEKKGQPGKGTSSSNKGNQQQDPKKAPGVNPSDVSRQRGGHAGYSPEEEQQQVNRENKKMHNERDEDDLDTSREEKIRTNEKTIIPGKNRNDDYKRNQ
jgi:hypothetical protein